MAGTSASSVREAAGVMQGSALAAGIEGRRRLLRDTPAALILIAPVILLFAIAVIYPLAETIRLSFWDIQGLRKPAFTGFGNYARLFSDAAFRNTLLTTLIFTIGTTVISVAIGWILAMLCTFAPQQTLPFRVMIFAAFGISEAVSGYMWIGIYRPDAGGLLNSLIQLVGFSGFAHAWLGDASTALWALIIAASWSGVGLPLMLIFAAIQAIPKSVLEAAYMDGAKPFSTMRHIMMPLSMPGVRVAVFINLLGALRAFDIIYILTGGGPVRATETVGYFMYRESMTQFKLGYGAAATVILLLAVLIVSIPAIVQRTAGAK
ncbi:carbohydrate ABC transporter permease [Rhizobium leguminosarum]|uniref:carbohydrate ABC transporter permease n=1 Tax=Rhizobium TaxID=379 RepID=UPI00102F36D2|nr:sugar ABC transporter permease [Rhizobium leguminosarum]TAU73402.1 sugar ABC transporter permease [Rhizobium leguminosarum]TAX02802.1 sugar ABC transporter permease [Rhizobium leguminosarum]TAY11409.1 sugar ABC transporter permease [Rhizobium leguminosarum]TAZ02652.1 sugar ABC transporter permease [Rhizobium leguminosarum]